MNALGLFSDFLNIFDWGLDVSGSRQERHSANLMDKQAELNKEAMSLQHGYNLDAMAKAQQYNVLNQQTAQQYAQQNMGTQAAYNSLLSNSARNMVSLRKGGINPTAGGTSSASSVGLPASSIPSSAANPSSALGVSSQPTIRGREFTNFSALASQISHENMLKDSQTNLNNIKSRTELAQNYANLKLTDAQMRKALSDMKYSDAKVKEILDPISGLLKKYEREMGVQQQNADSQAEIARAATKNANTAESNMEIADRQQKAQETYWKMMASISDYDAKTKRLLYSLELEKQPFVLDNLAAAADQYSSVAHLNDEQAKNIAEKMKAEIDTLTSNKEQMQALAKKLGVETDYLEKSLVVRLSQEYLRASGMAIDNVQKVVNVMSSMVGLANNVKTPWF